MQKFFSELCCSEEVFTSHLVANEQNKVSQLFCALLQDLW